MSETIDVRKSPRAFLADVERILSPVYAECFSEETRKARNVLLVISLVLLLSVLGVIVVGREPIKVPLLDLSVTATMGMRWILIVLCAYFFVLHSARSYMEWNLWRLRHQSPGMELSDLQTAISTQLDATYQSINAQFDITIELDRKLSELIRDPVELTQKIGRRDLLLKEYLGLGEQLHAKHNQMSPREFDGEAYKHHKLFEELDQLNDEIQEERQKHKDRIALERVDLETRLEQARASHLRQANSPERQALIARLTYLSDASQPIRKVLSIRFGLEALFPTVFALTAILAGAVAR